MTNINEYQILIKTEESVVENEFAVQVQQFIKEKHGALLPVCKQSMQDMHGIYIGQYIDNRDILPWQYNIAMHNSDLFIIAGSAAAYDYCFDRLCSLFTDNVLEVATQDFVIEENLRDEFELENNMIGRKIGDVRIMTHNIFGHDRNPTINPPRRFAIQREIYREYDADIVCLQEFSPLASHSIPSNMDAIGYKRVDVDTNGVWHWTPIYYKEERLRVIKTGFYLYTFVSSRDKRVVNDVNSKSLTWAVMEIKDTKRRFICMNTHLYWNVDGYDVSGKPYEKDDLRFIAGANEARIDNVREMKQVLDNIRMEPEFADLPVVFGGDLNCRYIDETRNSVKTLYGGRTALRELERFGFKSAQLTASKADTRNALCGYPLYDSQAGYYNFYKKTMKNKQDITIDHLFYMGRNIDALLFDVVDMSIACKSSDHLPIYCDFSVK